MSRRYCFCVFSISRLRFSSCSRAIKACIHRVSYLVPYYAKRKLLHKMIRGAILCKTVVAAQDDRTAAKR